MLLRVTLLIAWFASPFVAGSVDFVIRPEDRVVFCGFPLAGNSFDPAFVETYIATRWPKLEVDIVNWCWDGQLRVEEIVLLKPSVLIVPNARANTEFVQRIASVLPGVHLTPSRSNAVALLESWGAPEVVTYVEIDAPGKRVLRNENATVRELESDLVVAWSQDDNALPLPAALVRANGASHLNSQMLRVSGLLAGQYRLTIDGFRMGEFSNFQFDQGIDLTTLSTPMLAQAERAHSLTLRRMGLAYGRWEQAQPPEPGGLTEELERLEAEVLAQRRAIAAPKTHDYEITPLR